MFSLFLYRSINLAVFWVFLFLSLFQDLIIFVYCFWVYLFFFTVEREKREEEIGCLLFLNCYYCFGFPFSEVGFEGGFF